MGQIARDCALAGMDAYVLIKDPLVETDRPLGVKADRFEPSSKQRTFRPSGPKPSWHVLVHSQPKAKDRQRMSDGNYLKTLEDQVKIAKRTGIVRNDRHSGWQPGFKYVATYDITDEGPLCHTATTYVTPPCLDCVPTGTRTPKKGMCTSWTAYY